MYDPPSAQITGVGQLTVDQMAWRPRKIAPRNDQTLKNLAISDFNRNKTDQLNDLSGRSHLLAVTLCQWSEVRILPRKMPLE